MNRSPEHGSARLLPPVEPVRWVRVSGAIWRSSFDQVVVSVPDAQELLILRGTAAELWHALAKPKTLEELSRQLSRTFNCPVETVAADLASSMRHLASQGAVSASR